jgi:hypothetical protein
MGLFQDIGNIISGASSTPSAPPQVVVVQTPAVPPGTPTPAPTYSAPVVTENVLWVDPLTLKQWAGVVDSSGLFHKLEPVMTPLTSEAIIAGHGYQISQPRADGSFDVLADLGVRTSFDSTLGGALPTTTSIAPAPAGPATVENVAWVDAAGKQWAGHITNGTFVRIEPVYRQKPGLVRGHAYHLTGTVIGSDIGVVPGPKSAGGPLESLQEMDTATIAGIAVGAGAVLMLIGWAGLKATSKKPITKFFKDMNPTREFKPPMIGAFNGVHPGDRVQVESGYAYELQGSNWQRSKDDDWETVVITPGNFVTYLGIRYIDGRQVAVFKDGLGIYAQTKQSVRAWP